MPPGHVSAETAATGAPPPPVRGGSPDLRFGLDARVRTLRWVPSHAASAPGLLTATGLVPIDDEPVEWRRVAAPAQSRREIDRHDREER